MPDKKIEMFKIDIKEIRKFEDLPFSLYMKIGSTEIKFVKRFCTSETIDQDAIERYIRDDVIFLYANKDYEDAYESLKIEKDPALVNNPNLTTEQAISLAAKGYKASTTLLNDYGFHSSSTELVMNTVSSVITEFHKHKKVSAPLNLLLSSNGSRPFQHGLMTTLIGCKYISLFESEDETQNLFQKFASAGLLCDMSINDSYDKIRLNTTDKLEAENISSIEKDLIRDHALTSSNIAKSIPKLPSEISEIVLHHHGSATGKGFNHVISPSVSNLTMAFIIIQRFVTNLFDDLYIELKPIKMNNIVDELYDIFPQKTLTPIVDNLKNLFIQEGK